jgi:hypothetical protein
MTLELQQLPRRQEERVVFEQRARRLWSKVLRAVLAVTAFVADPLDLGTIIVVWHMTRAVPVLDILQVTLHNPSVLQECVCLFVSAKIDSVTRISDHISCSGVNIWFGQVPVDMRYYMASLEQHSSVR